MLASHTHTHVWKTTYHFGYDIFLSTVFDFCCSEVKVPLIPSPPWTEIVAHGHRWDGMWLLKDDKAIAEALSITGSGMVMDVAKIILRMIAKMPHSISLRAVAFLRQQYVSIAMPTPSLQGTADGVGRTVGCWVQRSIHEFSD